MQKVNSKHTLSFIHRRSADEALHGHTYQVDIVLHHAWDIDYDEPAQVPPSWLMEIIDNAIAIFHNNILLPSGDNGIVKKLASLQFPEHFNTDIVVLPSIPDDCTVAAMIASIIISNMETAVNSKADDGTDSNSIETRWVLEAVILSDESGAPLTTFLTGQGGM